MLCAGLERLTVGVCDVRFSPGCDECRFVPLITLRAVYGQRRAILSHCGHLPLIRYDHDQQKGRAEMASKKTGPKPGTPQAKHGGEATKAKYGTEFYSRLDKKGGTALKETRGFKHYSEIGKRGGTVTSARHGSEHYARIGAMGGNARKQRDHHAPTTESPAPEPPGAS